MTQDQIKALTRQNVGEFLPDAISKALDSYYVFMDQAVPDDAKGFAAHHSACKVAIAHVELLLKLAKWAELPEEKTDNQQVQYDLAAMMANAEKELQKYKETAEI